MEDANYEVPHYVLSSILLLLPIIYVLKFSTAPSSEISQKTIQIFILHETFCFTDEVLSASDELGQVFDRYTAVIVQGRKLPPQHSKSGSASLLDLSTPSEEKLPPVPVELLGNQLAGLGTGFCLK